MSANNYIFTDFISDVNMNEKIIIFQFTFHWGSSSNYNFSVTNIYSADFVKEVLH